MAVENEDDRLKRELGMDDMRVDRSAQKVDQRGAEERAMIDREVEANRELAVVFGFKHLERERFLARIELEIAKFPIEIRRYRLRRKFFPR